MNIELKGISIRELTADYTDNSEGGVVGFGEKLDIRPPYQREFVYKEKQRDDVINSVRNDFPLNMLYWSVRDDEKFEVIDGQQRIISICQYVNGDYAYEGMYFHNLQSDQQEQILDYQLTVYLCSGTDSERLDWFRTINIAGEKLTEQEIRNAVYFGSWVSDAKRYFSKSGCVAADIGSDYLTGSAIRQEYFETAIKWMSGEEIEEYMGVHQHDQNALALWQYFQSVITWVSGTFTVKRGFMKGVNWGELYNEYHDQTLDTAALEEEIQKLVDDDDVRNKGIYHYVLTREEKYLSIRAFSNSVKQKVYEKQKGICMICKEHFELSEMEADHRKPWHEGGKTDEENCDMLCKDDNRRKSGK